MRRDGTTAYASAQLMQLGEAQTFRVFDDHQAGIGHVHAHFDHRGSHQQLQFAEFKSLHHRLLFGWLHTAMHQPNSNLRQRQLQLFPGGFCRLCFQQIRLFNQRANPVSLTAFTAGALHASNDFSASAIGNRYRGNRHAARRQLINGGGIEIGIGRHRQRARNGRGGHDQLMRMKALLFAFFPQRQPLMHAKAVLFINDHQRQAVELHLFLENGVGADDHIDLAAGDQFLLCQPRFALLLTGQPAHFETKRTEPLAKVIGMLLSQQFGRSHQRNLFAPGDHVQRG